MKIIQTTSLTLSQKQSLFELWNSEYPEKIGYTELSEFENYLDGLSNAAHYLVIDDINQILGWAFTFFREAENWFGIIIDSKIQGKGFGLLLLDELKKNKLVLNGWVIDHQNDFKKNKKPYLSPLGFYTKNGFLVLQKDRIENEKISAVKIRWERE
jgi:GNAT superfamily N-acetyltransferase